MKPQELLRHHVTGAIERGEATPITEKKPVEKAMMNSTDVYFAEGVLAGKARRNKDHTKASFHMSWKDKALRLETPENRQKAQTHFTAGYRMGFGI